MINRRVDVLVQNRDCDVVVTNGLFRRVGSSVVDQYFTDLTAASRDPFGALISFNWLASCGGLFRAGTVSVAMFEELPKYFEWTTVAFRVMAAGLSLRFVDEAGFIVTETAGSLSRSPSFTKAAPTAVQQLLDLPLPRRVRRGLRLRLANAHHAVSEHALREGDRSMAVTSHLRSLSVCPRGFLRYVLYTRKLL
jgi:hypothetical protein